MIEDNVAVYCETEEESYLFLEWLVNNTNIQWSDGSYVNPKEDAVNGMTGYVITYNKLYFSGIKCDFNKFAAHYRSQFIVFKASDIISKLYNMPSKESLMDFLIGEENV